MPSSSRSSRCKATKSLSPATTLPPGNSHQPAMCRPAGRSAIRTRPAASNNAPATTRSGLPTLVTKQIADPQRYASDLGAALAAAGLSVEIKQEGEIWYVETTVPDKPDPRLVALFEKFEIFEIRPGALRIVVSQAQ